MLAEAFFRADRANEHFDSFSGHIATYIEVNRGRSLIKVEGMNVSAIWPHGAFIESVQPFHHEQDTRAHALWVLQELGNADKHRLLNTTGATLGMRGFQVQHQGGVAIKTSFVRGDGPVTDGAELARWQIEQPLLAAGQVTVEGDIAYDVAFEEAGPARGESVRHGLDMLGTAVKSILATLMRS
jgi:hypothetical protein